MAAAVVNGNYALDFGLKTDEAIYKDSVLDVEEYWNLIAARTADVEDPDTAAIYEKVVEAFQSSATEDVFNNTFGGYFIAVGWDQGFRSISKHHLTAAALPQRRERGRRYAFPGGIYYGT